MDYEAALKKLHADGRPLMEIAKAAQLPWTTVRDIKNGTTKAPLYSTVKKLAKHYGKNGHRKAA